MQLILTFSGKQGIELLPKIKQQRKKKYPINYEYLYLHYILMQPLTKHTLSVKISSVLIFVGYNCCHLVKILSLFNL